MYYSKINKHDIANGTGVRVTLFVSGCRNHCKGCFQPETWNFDFGQLYTSETEKEILDALSPDYISGLTLLGGDPFEEENQIVLNDLLIKVKEKYPQKNVWAFSGYMLDDIIDNGKKHTDVTNSILSNLDVLVDGPFIEEKKNLTLKFRGSENQRIIDIQNYLKTGKIEILS